MSWSAGLKENFIELSNLKDYIKDNKESVKKEIWKM